MGTSLEDVKRFPDEVRREVGYALFVAQRGQKHPSAKPLKGFAGATVLEIVEIFDTDTYHCLHGSFGIRAIRSARVSEEVDARYQDFSA